MIQLKGEHDHHALVRMGATVVRDVPGGVEVDGPVHYTRALYLKALDEAHEERVARGLRLERDVLLRASDWTMLADGPLTDVQRAAWARYRQALRDWPAKGGKAPHAPA